MKVKQAKTITMLDGQPLYKLFAPDMTSPYGKNLTWSLPEFSINRFGVKWVPGAWKFIRRHKPKLCRFGLHCWIGDVPVKQRASRVQRDHWMLFRVEVGTADMARDRHNNPDKIAVSRLRLLYPVLPGTAEYNRVVNGFSK